MSDDLDSLDTFVSSQRRDLDSLDSFVSASSEADQDDLASLDAFMGGHKEPFVPYEAEGFGSALKDRYKHLASQTSMAPPARALGLAGALMVGDEGDRERVMQGLQDEQMGADPSRQIQDFVSGIKNFSPGHIVEAIQNNPADFFGTLAVDPLSFAGTGALTKGAQLSQVAKTAGAVGGTIAGSSLARTTLDEGAPNLATAGGEALGAAGLTASIGGAVGAAKALRGGYEQAIKEIQKFDTGLLDAADFRSTKPDTPTIALNLSPKDMAAGRFMSPDLLSKWKVVAPSLQIKNGRWEVDGPEAKGLADAIELWAAQEGAKKKGIPAKEWGNLFAGRIKAQLYEGAQTAKQEPMPAELQAPPEPTPYGAPLVSLSKEQYAKIGDRWKDLKEFVPGVKMIDEHIYVPEGMYNIFENWVANNKDLGIELKPKPDEVLGSVGAAQATEGPASEMREWASKLGQITGVEFLKKQGIRLDDAIRARSTETSALQSARKFVPALDEVLQDILPEAGRANTGRDLNYRINVGQGRLLEKAKAALDPLIKAPMQRSLKSGWVFGRKIPNSLNDPLFLAMHGNFNNASPAIRTAAAKLRELFDETFHYVGPSLWGKKYMEKYRKDYMPILLNKQALTFKKNREGLVNELIKQKVINAKKAGHKNLEGLARSLRFNISQTLEEIMNDGWLVNPFMDRGPLKKHNIESPRKLFADIRMTPELLPYVSRDVEHLTQRYIADAVKYKEWTDVFGKGNKQITQSAFDKKGNLKKGWTGPSIRDRIEKQVADNTDKIEKASSVLEDLDTAIKVQQGTIRQTPVTQVASVSAALLHLTTVFGTALAEPILNLSRSHPVDFLKGAGSGLSAGLRDLGRIAAKIPRSEWERYADVTQTVMEDTMMEHFFSAAAGEQSALGAARHVYFKVNPIGAWTRMSRVMSARIGVELAKRNASELLNGAKGSRAERLLREMEDIGIKPEDAKAWVKDGAPMDTESLLKYNIAQAGHNFAEGTIMIPRGAFKPAAHHGPFAAMHVLMGYGAMFLNTYGKQITRDLQRAGWKQAGPVGVRVATSLSILIAWAYAWNMWKAQQAGQVIDRGTSDKMAQAVMSAIGGSYNRIYQASMAPKYGRSAVEAALGPAFTDAGAIGTGIGQSIQKGDMGPLKGQMVKTMLGSSKPIIGGDAYNEIYWDAQGYSADPNERAVQKKIEELEKDD